MSVDERVANLEQAFLALNQLAKKQDERHESVADSIKLLTEMIQRHDERLDSHDHSFDELDVKIAALTDAQIKTEESLNRLEALIERHITEGHK